MFLSNIFVLQVVGFDSKRLVYICLLSKQIEFKFRFRIDYMVNEPHINIMCL